MVGAQRCLAAGSVSHRYGLAAVWVRAVLLGCGLGSDGYGLGLFCLRPWRCMVAGSVLYGYWLHGVCPRVVMQSDGCGFVGCAPSDVRLRLRFCSMLAELPLHGREVSKMPALAPKLPYASALLFQGSPLVPCLVLPHFVAWGSLWCSFG